MATTALKASCLCKSAEHELTLPASCLPLPLTFCHCNSCRHYLGTLNLTTAVLPGSYKPSSDLISKLKVYDFFDRITDYFCPLCGTHMLFYVKHTNGYLNSPGYWAVHTGTLERADGVLDPDVHWFIGDTLDGGFADFLTSVEDKIIPRYAGFKGRTDELPLYWKSPEGTQITPSSSNKLHCYCKCRGVEFWIDKPDDGRKLHASLCACNSCRLDTGMEWTGWTSVPTVKVTLDVEGKVPFSVPFGTLKDYRSSHDVLRYHCDTCGATAFYQKYDKTDIVDVAIGLMDAPEGARAEDWLEWKTAGLDFREDALPRARSLTLAVEYGLEEYSKRKLGAG